MESSSKAKLDRFPGVERDLLAVWLLDIFRHDPPVRYRCADERSGIISVTERRRRIAEIW